MRLHRLEITAFGPYSGTERIDFDRLSDAGLFLIQGQTGAGKTTILDAVCFALYGTVPGARGRAAAVRGALRSDHAAPDQPATVLLETTVRGRRFRITRTAAWDRPKLRGTGTVGENAKVLLEELVDGGWHARSTRIEETADLLQRQLGMDADQFSQVAMLPQGDFAAFLRADAAQRQAVLERLFAAQIFTDVERWLGDHRTELGRQAAGLADAVGSIADRIAEVLQQTRPDGAGSGVDDVAALLTGWATEEAAGHADVRDGAEALLADAGRRRDAAREELRRGQALAERQRQHADALSRHRDLTAGQGDYDRHVHQLDLAARADRVLPLVRAAADRARGLARAAAAVDLARAAITDLAPGQAPEDVLRKAERDRLDQVAGLDGLAAEADRSTALRQQAARAAGRLAELAAELPQLAEALQVLPGRVAELRTDLDEVRVTAARREGAVAAVDDAARRLSDAHRRDRLTADMTKAQDAHRTAVDAAQDTRERLLGLRAARLEGMAAALAAELADGDPCQVCGSREHPDPAVALAVIASEADENRANKADERAAGERERAAARLAAVRADLAAAVERVGERDVAALDLELRAAQSDLDAIDATAGREAGLADEIDQTEALVAAARTRQQEATREETTLRGQAAGAQAEIERLSALLAQAIGADASLLARTDRLRREADLLAAAADALRAADEAARERSAAAQQAAEAAAQQGFADAQQAAAAALTEAGRADLTRRVREFEAARAAVAARLADPELTAAAALPEPDLAAIEQALADLEDGCERAARALDRATQRCERLTRLRAELGRRVGEWRPAAERHEHATRLAGIATGDHKYNPLGIRLSSYVLSHRLIQVVAAANERLARMSEGRYTLRHTDDRAAGTHKGRKGTGGLGLRVVDAWTGLERDPATLSGGESFVSSLALALGLADVVTTEAGGAEIGTLFVDEGFGTLDEQTLDEVMDVLDGLRDGGRAVGIVSHVAELRVRVPTQLQVRKTQTGSTTRVVG